MTGINHICNVGRDRDRYIEKYFGENVDNGCLETYGCCDKCGEDIFEEMYNFDGLCFECNDELHPLNLTDR